MSRFIRTFAKPALLAALLVGGAHAVAACSGSDVPIGDADGALHQKQDAGASDAGPAGDCAAQGGQCMALTPSMVATCGNWGDPAACGGGAGVGCCLHVCPDLVAPAPSFCPNGKVVVKEDASGCSYYDCEQTDGGGVATCQSVGGTCEGITPSNDASCPRWGDASKFSCGGGVGVGCCLAACPELAQPPPGFCDGGSYSPTYDATGCIVGFQCDGSAPSNPCTASGGTCKGISPGACTNWGSESCGGGVGVSCCHD